MNLLGFLTHDLLWFIIMFIMVGIYYDLSELVCFKQMSFIL